MGEIRLGDIPLGLLALSRQSQVATAIGDGLEPDKANLDVPFGVAQRDDARVNGRVVAFRQLRLRLAGAGGLERRRVIGVVARNVERVGTCAFDALRTEVGDVPNGRLAICGGAGEADGGEEGREQSGDAHRALLCSLLGMNSFRF